MENSDICLIKEKEINYYLLNMSNNPIIVSDGENITYKNTSYDRLLDRICISKDINLLNFFSLLESDNIPLNSSKIDLMIDNETEVCIQNENVKYCFILKIQYLKENNSYIIYLSDITQKVQLEEDKFNLLYLDNLTSYPNRIKLVDDLKFGRIKINALSIIDIISFAEVNDFFGHRTGDDIIINVANLINNQIKEYPNLILYKFPTDIYCIVNKGDDKKEFENIIKNIVTIIDKKVFHINENEINTRVRAGISFSEKNNKLITADIALQAAKKDQKDYLIFFDELDNIQEYQNNIEWTKKIKYAVENDKIIVYFQPLVNNSTLEVDKYECLVRMQVDNKVVSPYFFLDISKKCNQYYKITRIVIEKSCKTFSSINKEFSVNISYDDIVEDNFLDFIKDMFQTYNIKNKIVFEILEDESIKDYEILKTFISSIKELGCKVAIDDFGSGYSNFEHLLKMEIDYLKIDASIIKNVAIDSNSYKVTKTLIDFANSLNIKTIAEFVENKEIFDIVKSLGSNYSQGYYFSKPLEVPTCK